MSPLFQKQFPSTRECQIVCQNSRLRPVCGTDGQTHASKCEIRRLRKCEDKNVRLKHRGRCKTSGPTSKCFDERRQALEQARQSTPDVYIPVCKPDGNFAEVQCHIATGYCWCVADDGKPIPGSSVRGMQIKCRSRNGQKHRRGAGARKTKKRKRERKQCGQTDKATFNNNLIKLFSQEYARIPKPTPPQHPGAPKDLPVTSGSDELLDTPEKRVIEWKFSQLDVDNNNVLTRAEIRSLRRMLKKIVRPKTCAKKFHKYCDLDDDRKIQRSEWSVCLGVDINNDQMATSSTGSEGRGGIPAPSSDDTSAQSFLALIGRKNPRGRPIRPEHAGIRPVSDTERPQRQSEQGAGDKLDCSEQRRVAEEMDRADPEGGIFIPECLENGLYRNEQCHKSTGYCWCVDQNTGKPIPGTSTQHVTPKCDERKQREFKGKSRDERKQREFKGKSRDERKQREFKGKRRDERKQREFKVQTRNKMKQGCFKGKIRDERRQMESKGKTRDERR
ncbi:hypothetical protein NP493_16g05015 [Ridgeia piscesae]|uniref:Uncharacterized protein n=1 Tax=Ridgeia piscesae TaxID=27915 RepID=A0AAD9PE99_RIDPI|nr:hypothetical protein NP493_16g05015 [Ridgeia piscesae]